MKDNIFLQLVNVALGHRQQLEYVPTDEQWRNIFETAKQQTLIGVCFDGIERLPKEQRPPKLLLLQWIAVVQQIERQNVVTNRRSVEVTELFRRKGYRSCILKGQGNALMYPNPLRRQSGDIDIWVDGERTELLRLTLKYFPDVPFKYQHVEFPCLKDVEVELHYFPMYMQNPWGNRHLQRFFKRELETQMTHSVTLPGDAGQVCVPTPTFNAVYQLTHVFIHFIIEGIGLRHFLDYYYVLRNLPKCDREYVVEMLRKVNLYGFARAVMYVEHELLGLEDDYLIVPVDERRGKQLAHEIFQAGNFGKYETRYWHKGGGFVDKQWQKILRNSHFALSYPGEVMFEPFFRLYHAAWRAYMRRFVL